MYIWILLATIMVALSFFNVAPRADKEHALNEIKAATVVNRFKAEHSARYHAIECEIIYNKNNGRWDDAGDGLTRKSASSPVDVSSFVPSYTSISRHLPVGYYTGKKRHEVPYLQFVYCLRDPIENGTVEGGISPFVACDTEGVAEIGKKRYLVSFAKIPARWMTKEEHPTPLPMFVNLLAQDSGNTASYGWVEYKNGSYVLHGVGASVKRMIKKEDKDQDIGYFYNKDLDWVSYEENCDETTGKCTYKYKNDAGTDLAGFDKYVNEDVAIPASSALWQNSTLQDTCNYSQPCMLMYEVLPMTDPDCHCYNRLAAANANSTLGLAQCHNDAANTNRDEDKETVKNDYEICLERGPDGSCTKLDFYHKGETLRSRANKYKEFKKKMI